MNNIQCGNALVDSEYYLKSKEELFDDDDARRAINVFDWEKRFEKIFASGGFDCVIGNPPYVSAGNQVANENLNKQRAYLKQCGKYHSLYKQWDLYIPFMEKGLNILKEGGMYGAIVPYPLANQEYAKIIRRIITQNNLIEIANLYGTKVFSSATVSNCIPIVRKGENIAGNTVAIAHIDKENNIEVVFEKSVDELVIDEKKSVWNLEKQKKDITRHSNLHILGDFCYIIKGVCCSSDEKIAKGQFKKADLISEVMDEKHPRKYIVGKDIRRYFIQRHRFIEYETKRSPALWQRPKFSEFFMLPRLFTNILGDLVATIDIENNFINDDTTIGLVLWKDLEGVENNSISGSIKKYSRLSRQEMEELSEQVNLYYLLAILNSKYATYLLSIQRGDYIRTYPEHIRNLPIPIAPKAELEALTAYAKRQLELHAKLKEARLESDKQSIQTLIASLDAKIDEIVYAIYGLTQEEIEQLQ